MDSYFCCLHRLVFSDDNEDSEGIRYRDLCSESSRTSTSVECGIVFKFRFPFCIERSVHLPDSSSRLLLLGRHPQPDMAFKVWVPWHKLESNQGFQETLREQLGELPLTASGFLLLIDHAWSRLVQALYSLPNTHCDVIEIPYLVTIVHMHIYSSEARGLELATLLSMETTQSHMIPAAESAMQSLKGVEVPADKMEMCTICLEEMKGVCRATAMPCSHVFHGDCIREWLRTSHYCPVCRFEMPMKSVL